MNRICERIEEGETPEDLLNFEWVRFDTLKRFPANNRISIIRLAQSGFFYVGQGDNDAVECFSCSLRYSGWKDGDIPWEIHKQFSPFCEFVRGTDGNNFPIHERSNPSDHATALRAGTPYERGLEADTANGAIGGHSIDTGSRITDETNPTPKFEEFENFVMRSNSFSTWPRNSNVNTETLASAGLFYTDMKDFVRCFHCGVGLQNWEEGDNPWIEHAIYYPWCKNLLAQKGKDFIVEHSRQEIDFNEEAPINHRLTTTAENVIMEEEGAYGRERNSRDDEDDMQDVAGGLEEDVAQNERRTLAQENKRLIEATICKICFDNEKNVVFLPCSHMVCCQRCAPQITKCSICRQKIEGRIKIFTS